MYSKFIKKSAVFVLMVAMVASSCIGVFADDGKSSPSSKQTTYQFNEFKTLITLENQVDNKLSKSELTSVDLNKMETQLRNELSRRTKLSDEILNKMGYSSSDIAVLRTLTGNESLTTLAETKALLASVTCTRSLDAYKYKTAEDKTYFSVNISYKWDKIPLILWKDIVGIGWNNDYAIFTQTGSNVLKTTYINTLTGDSSTKKYTFVETGLCTSSVNITMNTAPGNQTEYSVWPKSGTAVIQLSATGKKTNSKFDFRYGHKTISVGSPSIAAPWGVGFTFSSVESSYAPSAGVLNASSPTVI